MKDLYLLTSETAIAPSKRRRHRNFWREKEVKKLADDVKEVICTGFDGKQDIISVMSSGSCGKIKEEHYVIVLFPDST